MKINYPIIYKLSYVYTTIALSKLFLAYEEWLFFRLLLAGTLLQKILLKDSPYHLVYSV